MKIIFSGGGTLGPVMPLLAVVEATKRLSDKATKLVWVGTHEGPERKLIEARGIRFYAIPAVKLRRYLSLQTLLAPFQFIAACAAAWKILQREKPDVLVSAGGFVSVPVHWAGWILRIPSVVHQQDIAVGLANRLIMPLAKKVTSAFIALRGAEKIGNPVRKEILEGSKDEAVRIFDLDPSVRTVLILGGGTGALPLNQIVADAAPELTQFCNLIHITGFNRVVPLSTPPLFSNSRAAPAAPCGCLGAAWYARRRERRELENNNAHFTRRYHQFPFMDKELPHALAVADLVVTRAGLSTLSELAALGKPAIIVPIPHSHQEKNAEFFAKHGGALLLRQEVTRGPDLVVHIRTLLGDSGRTEEMGKRMATLSRPDAAERLARIILDIHSPFGV